VTGTNRGKTALVAGAALALCATLAAGAFAASTNFTEPASSPEAAGDTPREVVAADLDGDSDTDLVFPNTFANQVTVLKNDGSGDLDEANSSPEAANGRPSAVAAADLDGDGDADLAVANSSPGAVTILRNNGSGNLTELATSPEPIAAAPFAIVAADLDDDGDPDLAVANSEAGTVLVLRNNGSGNFAEIGSSPEAVGTDAFSLAAADLDGDGDQDLASANRFPSTVTVLRNNGSGNFTEPASSPEAVSQFPDGIAAADLDGDGDSDLATTGGALDQVTILRNNGSANFVQPSSSPEAAGDRPFAIAAADFDADADQDLAVANLDSDDVTILRNNGSANFTEPASSTEPTQGDSVDVVAADLDGDTDQDVATANFGFDNSTILLNR
jgi:hypothetical protein